MQIKCTPLILLLFHLLTVFLFICGDNVITPTLNTPTIITPTIITPTLNTSSYPEFWGKYDGNRRNKLIREILFIRSTWNNIFFCKKYCVGPRWKALKTIALNSFRKKLLHSHSVELIGLVKYICVVFLTFRLLSVLPRSVKKRLLEAHRHQWILDRNNCSDSKLRILVWMFLWIEGP
jgi:hypothetical protein